MYVIVSKDGYFVHQIVPGGVSCISGFEIERVLCFEFRTTALILLSFLDYYAPGYFDVLYIADTDPRICDLDFENYFFEFFGGI